MDLFKPRGAAAPRRPTDTNQQNGVVTNTPRYAQLGGLNGANKVSKNAMQVKKPGDGTRVI